MAFGKKLRFEKPMAVILAFLLAGIFMPQSAFGAHGFEVFLDNNHFPRDRIAAAASIADFNFTIKSDWNSVNSINMVRISIPADYAVLDVNAIGWSSPKPAGGWDSGNPVILSPYSSTYHIRPDQNAVFQLRVRAPLTNGTAAWQISTADTTDSGYSKFQNAYTLTIQSGLDLGFDIRNEFGGIVKNATVSLDCGGQCSSSPKADSGGTGLIFFTSPDEVQLGFGSLYDFSVSRSGYVNFSQSNLSFSETALNHGRANMDFSVKAVAASDELGNPMDINQNRVTVSCFSCGALPTYFGGIAYFDSSQASSYTASRQGYIDSSAVQFDLDPDSGKLLYFDSASHPGAIDAEGLQHSVRLKIQDELGTDINISSFGISLSLNGIPSSSYKTSNNYAYFALNEGLDYNITSRISGWIDTNRNSIRPSHVSQSQSTISMPFALKVLGIRDELDYNEFLASGDTNFYWAGSDSNILRASFNSNFAYVAIRNDSVRDNNFTIRQKGFLDSNAMLRLKPTDQNTISFDNNSPLGMFGAKAHGNALQYNSIVFGATDQFGENLRLTNNNSSFLWNGIPDVAYRVAASGQAYAALNQFSGLSGFLTLRQKGFVDQNIPASLSFARRISADFDSNNPGAYSAELDGSGLLFQLKVRITANSSDLNGAAIQLLDPDDSTIEDVNGEQTWITPSPANAQKGYAYIAVDPSIDDSQTVTISAQADDYGTKTYLLSNSLFPSSQKFVVLELTASGGDGERPIGTSKIKLLSPTSASPVQKRNSESLDFSFNYSSYCPSHYEFFLSDPQTGERICSFQADLGWIIIDEYSQTCENQSGTTSGTGSCLISSDAPSKAYNATIELYGQSNDLLAKNTQANAVSIYSSAIDLEMEKFDSNSTDLNSVIDLNAGISNAGNISAAVPFSVSLYKNSIGALNELSSQTIAGLEAGQSKRTFFSLNASSLGKVVKIYVMADPNNDLNEPNRANNSLYLIANRLANVICYSDSDQNCQYPNLLVSEARVSNAKFEGQSLKSADIQVIVKNTGTKGSEGFSVTLYKDSLLNPIKSAGVQSLAIDGTKTITFHYSEQGTTALGGNESEGSTAYFASGISFYIFVDAESSVIETNKDDNIKLVEIAFSDAGEPDVNTSHSYTYCDPLNPQCFTPDSPPVIPEGDENKGTGTTAPPKAKVWSIRLMQSLSAGETQAITVVDENNNLLNAFHASITLPDSTVREYDANNGIVSFKATQVGTYSVLVTANALSIAIQFRALDVLGSVQQSIYKGTEIFFGSAKGGFVLLPFLFAGCEIVLLFLSAYVTQPQRFNLRLRKSRRRKISRLLFVAAMAAVPIASSIASGFFTGFLAVVLELGCIAVIMYIKGKEAWRVSGKGMSEETGKPAEKQKSAQIPRLPEGQLVVKTGPGGKVIYYMEPGQKSGKEKKKQKQGIFEGFLEELFGSEREKKRLLAQRLSAVQGVQAQPPKEVSRSKTPPQIQVVPAVSTGQEEIQEMKRKQLESMRQSESTEDLKKMADVVVRPIGNFFARKSAVPQGVSAIPVGEKEEEVKRKAKYLLSSLSKESEISIVKMKDRETIEETVRNGMLRAKKNIQGKPELYSRFDEMISDIEQQLDEIELEKGQAKRKDWEGAGGLELMERQLEEAEETGFEPQEVREKAVQKKKAETGIFSGIGKALFGKGKENAPKAIASGKGQEGLASISLVTELGFRIDSSKAVFAIEGKEVSPERAEGNTAYFELEDRSSVLARVDGFVDTKADLGPETQPKTAKMPYSMKINVLGEGGKRIDNAYIIIMNAKSEAVGDSRGNIIWVTPTPSNSGSGTAFIPISPHADDAMPLMLKVVKTGYKEIQLAINPNSDPVGEISFKRQLEKTIVLAEEEEEQ